MRNVIAYFVLAAIAHLSTCSLAFAQAAAQNPNPATGHGPVVQQKLPFDLLTSCAPGFKAESGAVNPNGVYRCRAVASCPSGQAESASVNSQGYSYSCVPTCQAGYTLTAKGDGTFVCKSAPPACTVGTSYNNDLAVPGGQGEADYSCTRGPN